MERLKILIQIMASIPIIEFALNFFGGMWWRGWLRHCATSQQVGGSIPDGVIEIFH
jgi:hypothetical protein